MTTWKPVPGHEANYEVSDLGQVRSRPRERTRGGLLSAAVNKVGYRKVNLYINGRPESRFVHQIVAAAFLGPRPEGLEVRHLDGNPLNNALSNLAYGTRLENIQDKQRHGTDHNAKKTHCPQGHPYDAENTAVYSGRRSCRTCVRSYHRELYRRKRAEQLASRNETPGGTR